MGALPEQRRPPAPSDDRRTGYRSDIQGLRAVAVLAVVANHMAGWPTGSFVGVDVFFVISGYLITGILVREFETRETISFRGFYARRIKRILPAGLFVIGATVCATRVLAGIDRYHFAAADAIAAVLFTANWHFARTGVNLYLWHFPVVVLIVTVVPQYSVAYWLAGLALMFGLSAASFHLLEDPARRGTWFRHRPGRVPIPAAGWLRYLAACAVTAVLAATGLVAVRAISPTRLVLGAPVLIGHTEDDPRSCIGAAALDPRHRCAALDHGDRVAPLPGQLPDDTGGAYACYAYLRQPIQPCDYGSRRPGAIRVALVGDSHAAALLAALEPQLEALNWRVTAFTGQTCGWLPAVLSPQCRGLRRIQRALLHGHYAIVIATEIRVDTSSVADHLKAMRPVAATGTRIVVVEDDPSVSPASTACVTRITYSATGACGTPVTVAYRDPDRLAQAAKRIAGARVVTTRRFYCRHGFCPATIGNVLVYRDAAAHVTASYARTVSPYLVEAIEQGSR